MTKEEVITLLCEHFSEGMVRTIIDALKQEQEYEVLAGIGKGVEIPAGWKYYYIKPKLPLQLKQEQDEPVAYFNSQKGGFYWAKPTKIEAPITVDVEPLPLYTKPQQGCAECGVGGGYALYCLACAEKYVKPEWLSLTDEDMEFLFPHGKSAWLTETLKVFEAKLKQKNNIGENN